MPPITGYEDLGDFYENPWQPRQPRTPGQQPPETGPGNGPGPSAPPSKMSADQRALEMLSPAQRAAYDSLVAQAQAAGGGYYNPRIGVGIARGLQNGMSPELIMQEFNSYLDQAGGTGTGYERAYTAFVQSHDSGQNFLNRTALGYWGNRRNAYGGPITQPGTYGNGEPGGGVPYDGPHTYDPTGGTRPGRGGPPPTGGGETRGGGLGEPPAGGGSGGGYGYDPTGGGRGDRGGGSRTGSGPLIEDRQPIGGYGGPSAASLRGGGGGRFQQPQAQAQPQPRTVTIRYDYGGGASAGAAKPQAYGAQAQRQTQQNTQPTAYGTDRSNVMQPSMRRTQPTSAPTQPRYVAPMAQNAQNKQGPQGYGQGYYGQQGPRNWFGS